VTVVRRLEEKLLATAIQHGRTTGRPSTSSGKVIRITNQNYAVVKTITYVGEIHALSEHVA